MLVAAKRRKSNSDDGKIGIPDAKVDEAISDDESSFEGEKAKPAVKQVQVVDLESSSESDDDSIVEEENPKPPGRSVQTVVLESSSDCSGDSSSDSSDDEEDDSKTPADEGTRYCSNEACGGRYHVGGSTRQPHCDPPGRKQQRQQGWDCDPT